MICSQIISYIVICLIIFVMYPKYSLEKTNIIGNILSIILLYYLCKNGYKSMAWAFVLLPLIIVLFNANSFNKIASSYK